MRIEVELIEGEDGVSPGQACVFYASAEGQARVLGGGFIKSAIAADGGGGFAHGSGFGSAELTDPAGERAMGAELDKETITKAYARWAPVYDLVFGAVFERGRRASIAAAERIGGRILEVGVGTGISLPDYARKNRLIGVDISEPMLHKGTRARRRTPPRQCRGTGRDGRRAPRFPGRELRRGGRAICHHDRAGPGGDAR